MTAVKSSLLRRVVSSFCRPFVRPPKDRAPGISAMIRVKDEERWLEPCILSIEPFVEEIVAVDNGSKDRSTEIIQKLADRFPRKLRAFSAPDLNHRDLSNFSLAQTRCRWIIKWDSDFVAHTSGPNSLESLRRRLLSLDPGGLYFVRLPMAELAGDLFHRLRDCEVRRDGFAVVYSPGLQFVWDTAVLDGSQIPEYFKAFSRGPIKVKLESLKVPWTYQVFDWNEVHFFHLNIKPWDRMVMKLFWLEWMNDGGSQPLEQYVRARLKRDFSGQSFESARETMKAVFSNVLVDFNPERFGGYPDVLKERIRKNVDA